MINEINVEREKSDKLTVAKLNAVKQFNKQTNHKSKLMTEKYSLLPLNPQQLTTVQTAIQRMSEKHPYFEIEPVNTIQPPEIKYTQMPMALVPIDTPLSIICKHIPRQSDIDKIVNVMVCEPQKGPHICQCLWSEPISNCFYILGSVSIPSFETMCPKYASSE